MGGLRQIAPQVGDEIPPLALPIAREMMARFAVLIDDCNPVHLDDAFAQAKGFPAAIAHSAVGSSLLLRMLTSWLGAWPLQGDALDLSFVAPVLVGATLTGRGRCIAVTPQGSLWDVWCENQDGRTVIAGKARIVAAAAA